MESDSDHEEDMNSPQRPKFPKARTGNEPGMYGGFGGDGPSQAWLKAKGYIKSHFEGGSGRLDEETSVVEVRPVENDDKAKRDEERRQKMLARFESGKKQEPEMWEKAVVKKEIVLTEAEKDRRRRLAEKREFGLVMSKFALEETNKIPEIEPPKQRIISPEEERKRELLTQWHDLRVPDELVNIKTNQTVLHLDKLFDIETYSDLTIILDSGETIKAHKIILASRSSVFEAMLTSSMLEASLNEVHINGYSYDAVRSMLMYLYTGKLKTDNQHIMELLYLAGLYRLNGLKIIIQIELEKCIDEDNLEAIWDAAIENEAIELREKCIEFCWKNMDSIRKVYPSLPSELKAEVIRLVKRKKLEKQASM